MSTTPVINFDEIKSKISSMSPEERAKKLEAFRSRQLLQQKKSAAKGGQALYNKRRTAEFKALKEAAIADGTWSEIEAIASQKADEEFDKFLDSQSEPSEDE